MKSTTYERGSSRWSRGLPRRLRTGLAHVFITIGRDFADYAVWIAPWLDYPNENEAIQPDPQPKRRAF